MVNVVAVFQDFGISSVYYSCNIFGMFKIEEFIWNDKDSCVYRDKMRDLQNSTIPVVFPTEQPGMIISENVNGGETRIGGYVGNIFMTFAKRHNGRMNTLNVKAYLTEYDLLNFVLNETIEISGAGILVQEDLFEWHTFPYIYFDWGVMLPVEPNIPIYKVFAYVFYWEAFVIIIVIFMLISVSLDAAAYFLGSHRIFAVRDVFFNIDCFRGMLGQSFFESPRTFLTTKILYSLIFLFGIIIITSYNGFLQSFMTEPPREKTIGSFDDLQQYDIKILSKQTDIENVLKKLKPEFMNKYSNIFHSEISSQRYFKLRDSLDTKYAFPVSEMTWHVF
ncbi:uncharacterized protein LOC129918513 [Episyrphus balteatus]|uniref:uncharacterized protein LOC129918513 n=1 Tax=Episyrphus balteatus TaxID=286459 RepID=UPI00248641FB|nr:uncharacterized protein LOC129918513 [Episyrphus balteatus]